MSDPLLAFAAHMSLRHAFCSQFHEADARTQQGIVGAHVSNLLTARISKVSSIRTIIVPILGRSERSAMLMVSLNSRGAWDATSTLLTFLYFHIVLLAFYTHTHLHCSLPTDVGIYMVNERG